MSAVVSPTAGGRLGGRYQIVREIGAGGMGRVYQAIDAESGKVVAAKVLIPGTEDHLQDLLRFYQEGAVLATLKHPSIVEVYATFLEDQTCCIIMEMLDGHSLGQVLAAGPLPLPAAKRLIRQVASALAYAHSRGVIHRDVKPDNIMVVGDDTAKVMDFGIARILRSGSRQTMSGLSLGTPLYMAPEQAEGKELDGRSDVYSLGAVLYQMVTGKPPFEGEDPLAVAYRQIHETPVSPRQHRPRLPEDWEQLILRALAKDSSERFQTMIAFEARASKLSLHQSSDRQFTPVPRSNLYVPTVPTSRIPAIESLPAGEALPSPSTSPRPVERVETKHDQSEEVRSPATEAVTRRKRTRFTDPLAVGLAATSLLLITVLMVRTNAGAAPSARPSATSYAPTSYAAQSGAAMHGRYVDPATGMGTRILKAITDARGVGAQRPPAGLIWEFLHVKLVSASHAARAYNRYDFEVVDRQGEIFHPTISLGGRPALGSGLLGPGQKTVGWIGFQLPADIGSFSLTWSDGYHLTPPAEILQYSLPGQ